MNEHTEAGGCDFPETPQPKGVFSSQGSRACVGHSPSLPGRLFSLFSYCWARRAPGCRWVTPEDQSLERVPGHAVCVLSPPMWIWSPRGPYAGFSRTTEGTSWAPCSWVWACRDCTFTASQLEFTKCCRKGPKPETKDSLVCSGQAWAKVALLLRCSPHLLGDLLWFLGPSRARGAPHIPFLWRLASLPIWEHFPILLCEVLWGSPKGMWSWSTAKQEGSRGVCIYVQLQRMLCREPEAHPCEYAQLFVTKGTRATQWRWNSLSTDRAGKIRHPSKKMDPSAYTVYKN